MAIRMHDRKAARIIGEPYFKMIAPPKPTAAEKEDAPIGVMIFTPLPKRTKVQDIEYVTERRRETVPFAEIYDPREPEEMNLARLALHSV